MVPADARPSSHACLLDPPFSTVLFEVDSVETKRRWPSPIDVTTARIEGEHATYAIVGTNSCGEGRPVRA